LEGLTTIAPSVVDNAVRLATFCVSVIITTCLLPPGLRRQKELMIRRSRPKAIPEIRITLQRLYSGVV
jgi:hypothetical protein